MHKSLSSNDVNTRLLLTHSCVIHEEDYVYVCDTEFRDIPCFAVPNAAK